MHRLYGNVLRCPFRKSIWPPNTLREDVPQYHHFEKTDPHPALIPNHTYSEPFNGVHPIHTYPEPVNGVHPNHTHPEPYDGVQEQSMAKDVEELFQQLNGFETSEQWLFPSCNGDMDTCTPRPEKLLKPPGLPMPNATNTYLSKMRKSEHQYISINEDSGNCESITNVPATSDSFAPQCKMSSLYVDPYNEDHSDRSSFKPIVNGQHKQQDINRFVSNFQNAMALEQGSSHGWELHNTMRQAMEMLYEDSLTKMDEQRKYTSPEVSAQSASTMQIPKEMVEEFEAWQRERNGVRKRLFRGDVNGFGPQNTEYLQKPTPNSALFNPTNSSQFNTATQNGNPSRPLNLNMNVNQHSEHHSAQNSNQAQKGIFGFQDFSHGDGPSTRCWPGRNQVGIGLDSTRRGASDSGMQLNKNTMLKAAVLGEGFLAQCLDGNTRPHTRIHMSNGDRKQGFPQNMYHQGNMYNPQQFRGHNTNGARKKPQPQPFMYPLSDPRQSSGQMPLRPTLTYIRGTPFMDVGDMMPGTECTSFNPSINDLVGRHGEIYPGMTSVLRSPSMMKNQGRPMSELHIYLDKCYEQWNGLENERKKVSQAKY